MSIFFFSRLFEYDKTSNYSGIKKVYEASSHCPRTARMALYLEFPFFLAVSTTE